MKIAISKSYSIISVPMLLLGIYFFISPMEDILTGSFGTIHKYLALFLGLTLLISCIGRKVYPPKFILFPLYFILVSWVSLIWAVHIDIVLVRNVAYTLLPMLYCVVMLIDFSKNDIHYIDSMIMFGGMFTSIYFLVFGIIATSGRASLNESNDPNGLCGLLLLPLVLSIKYFIDTKKLSYLFSALLILLVALSTGSRGFVVSCLGMFLCYFFYAPTTQKKLFLRYLPFVFLILILVTLFLPEDIFSRIFLIENYTQDFDSSETRSAIWKTIFLFILPELPPWGLGSGNSPAMLAPYFGHLKAVHNTYINIFLEFGIFGLPVLVFFLSFLLKKLLKNDDLLVACAFVGICLTIFFLDAYAKKYFWNMLMYASIRIKYISKCI